MTRTFCASFSSILSTATLVPLITLAAATGVFASSEGAPRFAKLRVESDPPGADVVIVAELGKTPLTNEFLNPGMYKLEIRHRGGYLPVVEELTLRGDQHAVVAHTLKRPQLFTKRRQIQLALGAAAAAGFVYAMVEQRERSIYQQKSRFTQAFSSGEGDEYAIKAGEYSELSRDAGIKRTVAAVAAGTLSAALQVTVFIW